MGSKRYLSPREILGDRRRDRQLTAAEILSDELEDEPASGNESAETEYERGEPTVDSTLERRDTAGADWQWLDDQRVESRSD